MELECRYSNFNTNLDVETAYRKLFDSIGAYKHIFADSYRIVTDKEEQKLGIDIVTSGVSIDEKLSYGTYIGQKFPPTFMFELFQPEGKPGWFLDKNKKTDVYSLMIISKWEGTRIPRSSREALLIPTEQIIASSKEMFVMMESRAAIHNYLSIKYHPAYEQRLFDMSKKLYCDKNNDKMPFGPTELGLYLKKCDTKEGAVVLVIPFKVHFEIAFSMFYLDLTTGYTRPFPKPAQFDSSVVSENEKMRRKLCRDYLGTVTNEKV